MPKGFDKPTVKQLGFILVVVPSANAYAADFSLDGPNNQFLGITNMLDSAQVWRKPQEAESAISLYSEIIRDQVLEEGKVELHIRKLHKKKKKIMKGDIVKTITFYKEDLSENSLD